MKVTFWNLLARRSSISSSFCQSSLVPIPVVLVMGRRRGASPAATRHRRLLEVGESRPLLFEGEARWWWHSAEAEGSLEAVADAISVALAIRKTDADGNGVGEVRMKGGGARLCGGGCVLRPEAGCRRRPGDRAVMGRRVVAI